MEMGFSLSLRQNERISVFFLTLSPFTPGPKPSIILLNVTYG